MRIDGIVKSIEGRTGEPTLTGARAPEMCKNGARGSVTPLIPTPAAADVTVRTLEHEADAGGHEARVEVDAGVGEIEVTVR